MRLNHEQAPESIAEQTGLPLDMVNEICRTVDRSEFKRFQAAIVPKIAARTFGPGRPIPVVMKHTAITESARSHAEPADRP